MKYLPIAFVKNVGTASSSSSSATSLSVTVPAAGCKLGNLLVVDFASFNYNGGTGTVSISDTRSQGWGQAIARNTVALGINSLWYVVLTTAMQSGDTITVSFPSGNQCYAMTVNEFSGLAPAQPYGSTTGTASASTTPSDTGTPASNIPGCLWYGMMSTDAQIGETFTEDTTNTVGGSWISGTPALTASSTGAVNVRNAYKIPNTALTSSQTWAPTLGTTRDWVENLIVFSGAGTGYTTTVTGMPNAVRRAAVY